MWNKVPYWLWYRVQGSSCVIEKTGQPTPCLGLVDYTTGVSWPMKMQWQNLQGNEIKDTNMYYLFILL